MWRGMLVGIASVALTLGTGVGVPAAAAPSQGLSWGPCPHGALASAAATPRAAALECATLNVPLDYRQPTGRTITVEVSRLASTHPTARRGVLLLNPGGPGGPGLDLPLLVATLAPQTVLDAYDLIGFDPRGVGQSTPVTCGMTAEQQENAITWPLPGGMSVNAAVDRQIAKQCAARSGALLPYITTANTARDMDRIRAALGEPRISYYGVSYGSYLGAVYASLYPQRTDRIILDSNVDPTRVWREQFRGFGPAAELRFPDFAAWAAIRNDTYGLGATPDAVRHTYFTLAEKLDAQPQHGVTGNMFRGATFGALYGDAAFPFLAQLWQKVSLGEASLPPNTGPADDSSAAALFAVVCDDVAWPRSVSRYEHDVAQDSQRYPLAGGMAANFWPCAFWATQPVEPLVPITSDGPHNILLLNNLRDPATPYFGAQNTRRVLGERASLVTVNQGGHGVWLFTQNACANNLATQWLINGILPADTYCPHIDDPTLAVGTAAGARAAAAIQQKQRWR